MKIEIAHATGRHALELPPGRVSLGGADGDGIRVEGLPASLLTLEDDGGKLLIESTETLPVGGVLCPPGVLRLVLDSETIDLPGGFQLRQVAPGPRPAAAGTVAVLRSLMANASEPAASRAATLTCLTGLDLARTFALADGPNELGRGVEAGIRIRDRAVSRRHARIAKTAEGCVAEDLGGPNGVFVNGQRLQGARRLEDGDILELGHSLLRFSGPAPEPPPADAEPGDPDTITDRAPSPAAGARPPAGPDGAARRPAEPDEATQRPAEPDEADLPATAPLPSSFALRASSEPPPADWLLLTLGTALALLGVLVTWGLAISRAP